MSWTLEGLCQLRAPWFPQGMPVELKEMLPTQANVLPTDPRQPVVLSAEAHTQHFPWYQMPQAMEARPARYHGSSEM